MLQEQFDGQLKVDIYITTTCLNGIKGQGDTTNLALEDNVCTIYAQSIA